VSLRVVIFDLDGTLTDSRAAITSALEAAFASQGMPVPAQGELLAGVGLSLPQMVARLLPEPDDGLIARMVAAYKDAYFARREAMGAPGSAPLFEGARALLERLRGEDETLMAIATGKSRRGTTAFVEGHGFQGWFQSVQCADDHPSKPHPSMIEAVLRDCGTGPERAVMIGDTSYDMDMARAAGVGTIGVSWGYHAPEALMADRRVAHFAALAQAIDDLTGQGA